MSSRYVRPSNCSLYVRNVPYGDPEGIQEEMKDMFSKYGPVRDVYVPVDYRTHKPRGFAYIQFEYARDADDALHYLDRVTLGGRELEIEFARGDRKTPHEMRRKEGSPPYSSSRHGRSRSRSPRRRSRSRSPRRRRSRSPRRPRRSRSGSRRAVSQSRSRSRSRSRSAGSGSRKSSERSGSVPPNQE